MAKIWLDFVEIQEVMVINFTWRELKKIKPV